MATSVDQVRQIHPEPRDEVDPLEVYPRDPRPRGDRPWVMLNMVTSLDGATATGAEQVSGPLGGAGDRRVFRAVRASCDWIVVAAGTARAEGYRRPRVDAEVARVRAETGRIPVPRLAVVTARGELDPDAEMFAPPPPGEERVLVVAGRDADRDRLSALEGRAEVVVSAATRPDPVEIVDVCARRGGDVVLVEGGPGFNGPFVAADLLDELCWSVGAVMVAGSSARLAHGPEVDTPRAFRLDRLLVDEDSNLFGRWVRRR